MSQVLRILLLEDNEDDAGLVEHALKKSGLEFNMKNVASRQDYIRHIEDFYPDLVLSDHALPQFDSIEALKICKKKDALIPFIIVTGTVSEEFAVECLKMGADDYILKGNLTRLSSAISNALRQKKAESERNIAIDILLRSEEHFRKLIENSSDIFAIINPNKTMQYLSPSVERVLGYTPEELKDKSSYDYIHKEDHEQADSIFIPKLDSDSLVKAEFRFRHKLGSWHYLECISKPGALGGNTIINIRDISERKAAEEELKRKNSELEKINKELDSFVYSASHDLRAPLKSILGLVKLSKDECNRNVYDSFEKYMEMMEKSIYKLDETIQEIIYYSGNARSSVLKELIDFNAIIDGVYEKLKYQEIYHAIEKITVIESGTHFVSDKNRLTVIFNNLISNGIKYFDENKSESYLKIEIKMISGQLQILYRDNGIGIHKQYLPKVFDMFFRATERSEGSGLGLYIVKEIVEKLGGTIEVQSEVGVGTTFNITLPLETNQIY